MSAPLVGIAVMMAAFALGLAGCGGQDPSGATTGVPAVGATVTATGVDICFACHKDSANPSGKVAFGDSAAARAAAEGWLSGPHGNNETMGGSTSHPYNIGFPDYAMVNAGRECRECHDRLGEGMAIGEYYDASGDKSLGIYSRPVTGCESCHPRPHNAAAGAGVIPKPGPDACGQCHNQKFEHHAEGDNIYEDYSASPHSRSINSHVIADAATGSVRARCSRCHTDVGAQQFIANTPEEISMAAPAILNAGSVQCRTCHDAHNPRLLLKDAGTDALGNVVSAEYNTCTFCHQVSGGYHGEGSAYSWGPQPYPYSVGVGNFESNEIIYDTHMDNPLTATIEGYVIDQDSPRACRGCHNPHNADTTINEEWAVSGHAGEILEVKETAFMNASGEADPVGYVADILNGTNPYGSVGDETGPAWAHYDFKAANRTACQRCHTSTGFMNFASGPLTYSPANNVFAATAAQREMLYCWACHTNNVGALRDPGPFSISHNYGTSDPADRIGAVPDMRGSNICVSCHSGRKTGAEIKATYTDATIVGQAFSTFSPHYLSAGGTLYRTTGYEYAGRSYANKSYFKHNLIGMADTGDAIDVNGPCVGCHMSEGEGHTFSPVTKDASGMITAITGSDAKCSECHSGLHLMTAQEMNEQAEGFHEALAELEAALGAAGIYYGSNYPYFFNNAALSVPYKAWPSLDVLGSAFNFALLHHEPGAYVHNRFYTKRLIYDSIDMVDDSVLNDSVSATITNATARGWVLSNGGRP